MTINAFHLVLKARHTHFSKFAIVARLVGSNTSSEGRLEIRSNFFWGTVCDDGFSDTAARVVCNMLGFGYVHDCRLCAIIKGLLLLYYLLQVICI